MLFKQIDRYVGRRFLAFLVGALILMSCLYGSFDLLKRVEEMQQAELTAKLSALGSYYAYLLPLFLLDILPALVLVAAGMVLVQMVKSRELLVLKASGVGVYRTLAPVFFWTVAISLFSFTFQQALGPQFTRRKELLGRRIADEVEGQLLLEDPAAERKLFIGQYDFATEAMKNVSVLEFYPGSPRHLQRTLFAQTAQWQGRGVIRLEMVTVQEFDRSGGLKGRPRETPLPERTLETGLASFDFVRAAEESLERGMILRTLGELREQIRRNPDIPDFRVIFHSRIASFFTPFILLLIGIPCLIGFEQSINSRLLGVIVCILVAGGFYVLNFVFNSMGSTGTMNPVIAGWLPPIIGGSAGLWMFEAMLA